MSEISEWAIWVPLFRKMIYIVDEILLVELCIYYVNIQECLTLVLCCMFVHIPLLWTVGSPVLLQQIFLCGSFSVAPLSPSTHLFGALS